MPNITIDGNDYDTDSFSDEAKKQLGNLQFTQAEINRLQSQIAIAKTAQAAYTSALKLEIES